MKISLSIPSSCHEDWNKFTPTERGKFCQSCKTEVINFTSWTDQQLIVFFANGAKSCGRFTVDQLKVYEAQKEPKKRTWWLGAFVIALLAILNRPAVAQSPKKVETEQVDVIGRMDKLRNWSERRSDTSYAQATKMVFRQTCNDVRVMGGLIVVVTKVSSIEKVVSNVVEYLFH